MIVRDRSTELKEFLDRHYASKIEGLKETANQSTQIAMNEVDEKLSKAEEKLSYSAKQEFETYELQQLSSAKLQAKQIILFAENSLFEEVKSKILSDAANLPLSHRTKIVKKLLANIQANIKEDGYKVSDFTFYIPSDIKITNAISSLDSKNPGVIAESDSVVFERSFANLLEENKFHVMKGVFRHIEDTLD